MFGGAETSDLKVIDNSSYVKKSNRVVIPMGAVLNNLGIKLDFMNTGRNIVVYKDNTIGKFGGDSVTVQGSASKVFYMGAFTGRPHAVPIVVVDAGHGGSDGGAYYGGIKEKTLNLDIALRLEKLLQQNGIKVYMTRTDDSFSSLYDRSALANSVDADLLVSVHNNAADDKRVSGIMTLYYPGTENNTGKLTANRFAHIIQNQLVKDLSGINRGVIQRPNLAVLRTSKMPAVIAEIGFMTNATELSKLSTQSYRQKAAESLKVGVLKALNER